MQYAGGKNNCYQHIINQMPPHKIYIETHLGSGAVLRQKRVAQHNVGIDLDPVCINNFASSSTIENLNLSVEDCLSWMETNKNLLTEGTLIYSDPPYVFSSRKSARRIYKHEYTDSDHVALLNYLKSLPCMIIISGYDNELYNDLLPEWRKVTFTAQSRKGQRTETLWVNYDNPTMLHDYSYLGSDYRERERIKRKSQRWLNRFSSLPLMERQRIIGDLVDAGVLQHRHR